MDPNTYSKTKIFLIYFVIVFLFELIIYYTNTFIITENALRSSYSFLDSDILDRVVSMQKNNILLGYFVIPILILLRCLLFSLPVYTVLYVQNESKINFKTLFIIALYGEFIFIISGITKIIILTFTSNSDIIAKITGFIPFSLKSLTDYLNISTSIFQYPLQMINLFELYFWILAGYSIANVLNKRSSIAFRILLMGYGSALLVWCLLVIFIQLILV